MYFKYTLALQDFLQGFFCLTATYLQKILKGYDTMSNNETITANSKKTSKRGTNSYRIRKMTVTAILAAAAAVLQLLEFSIPIIPSFIKLDFSELPALIASFSFGPLSGVAVCLIKNLIKLSTTMTGGIGELSNFILGCMFVIPAGLIYKHKKTRTGAILGASLGAAAMAIISVFSNYYIVYPIYSTIMPAETIIAAYNAILSSVTNLWQALLIFNMPFTFFKGICSVLITLVIYKPLSPILKGKQI